MSEKDVWRERYEKYLKSQEWKQIRERAIEGNYNQNSDASNGDEEQLYCCDGCGWNFRKKKLQVHHIHYHGFIWGQEKRSDLMVVCSLCHLKEDEKRAERGRRRSQEAWDNALLDAAFQTYLDTKYYEGYDPPDPEWEWECFIRWLEIKQLQEWF